MSTESGPIRLIFVGGAPRSGTTLVQRILDAHSLISAGPEFDLVPEIMLLRDRFKNGILTGRISTYLDQKDVDVVFQSFVASIFRKRADETGTSIISEKTPSNLMVFPELLECLPDARFVFVVRDPRAIVASMLEVGRKYRRQFKFPPSFTRSARRAIEYINSLWCKGLEGRARSGRVLLLYYEDIVTNPGNTIEALTNFLQIPFEDGLLDIQSRTWQSSEFKASEELWYSREQLVAPISAMSLEKWRTALSPYDLYVIGKHLVRTGNITDRYAIETRASFRWAANDFLGSTMYRLYRFAADFLAKVSRVL